MFRGLGFWWTLWRQLHNLLRWPLLNHMLPTKQLLLSSWKYLLVLPLHKCKHVLPLSFSHPPLIQWQRINIQCSPSVSFSLLVKQGWRGPVKEEPIPNHNYTTSMNSHFQAVCCPDWEGGPWCCLSGFQCAPNGSENPCMMMTKPANVTYDDGHSMSPPSFMKYFSP